MLKKETCQHCSFFGSNFTQNRIIPKIFHLKFSKCVNWTKHLAKYQLILSNLTMLSSGGLNLSKSFSFDYSYFARGFIISGTKLRYNHLLWNPSAWQKSAFNNLHRQLYLQLSIFLLTNWVNVNSFFVHTFQAWSSSQDYSLEKR